jgi:iron complex outermembrane receptor protein
MAKQRVFMLGFYRLLALCAAAIVPQSLVYAQQVNSARGVVSRPLESGPNSALGTVLVEATPLGVGGIDLDKVPGNVTVLTATDLFKDGVSGLTESLNAALGSISINENLNDSFQPDLLFRGFEASPVLGTAQGLAVYQNGVRINEAFGDTVNWDLFPDMAIDRVSIVSSSPVYGLNALGGGVSLTMKNGWTYQSDSLDVTAGAFGHRGAGAQYGIGNEHFAFYVAANAVDAEGWRQFSSDRVRQVYVAFSSRIDHGSMEFTYAHAGNTLRGQSATPVQELAVDRTLVFTGPQKNVNTLDFFTLNVGLQLPVGWRVNGLAYYRRFAQSIINGNTSNYQTCAVDAYSGLLCQSDGQTPVRTQGNALIPDISENGLYAIGSNDFEDVFSVTHGAAVQISALPSIARHDNNFSAGITLDQSNVEFGSGSEVGVIDPRLQVIPSGYEVVTAESTLAGLAFGATPVKLRNSNRYLGYFFTDTFSVTPAVNVTLSGRYNVATIGLQDELGNALSGSSRYARFNPAIGVTYRVTDAMTMYAGVSQNTRSPTPSEIECSDPSRPCMLPSRLAGDPPNLRQVIARTVEAGVRGAQSTDTDAARRWTWNASIFSTRLQDDIYGIATGLGRGYFQNIGATRREGFEIGLKSHTRAWHSYASVSDVRATFNSDLVVPAPFNPQHDQNGNIHVRPGDHLPGIAQWRFKAGVDYSPNPRWSLGSSLSAVSGQSFFGDESNQNPSLPGYAVVGLHASYLVNARVQIYTAVHNLLSKEFATYGIFGDPAGVGALGVPVEGIPGASVDNRFESPAAPRAVFVGLRLSL